MIALKNVISIYGVAKELEVSEDEVAKIVSSGILTPYVCKLRGINNTFMCIKYYGKGSKCIKSSDKREYFIYDWKDIDNLCFDCMDIQAYIEEQNAIKIPDAGVCGKPDYNYIPDWKIHTNISPLDRMPHQEKADNYTLATVAGWLEVAKMNNEKEEKIETLTVGLAWLRGDCSQEIAFHAYHGGEGKLLEKDKQWERKRRQWFLSYAQREGLDVSQWVKIPQST